MLPSTSSRFFWLFCLACLFVLAGCTPAGVSSPPPRAQNGEIDLRGWDFKQNGALALDGEWLIYWEELVEPGQLAEASAPVPYLFPSSWNGQMVNGRELDTAAYATFRLKVLLPESGRYGFKLHFDKSAYRLWVNGDEVSQSGVVSEDLNNLITNNRAQGMVVDVPGETAELVLQFASNNYYRGGPRASIIFGPADDVLLLWYQHIAQEAFVFGCILMIGVYQILLYFLRRKNNAPLYISLFCIAFTIWASTQGETLLWQILPNLPGEWMTRIEFISIYTNVPLIAMFAHATFPKLFTRPILHGYQLLYGGLTILAVLAPAGIFSLPLPFAQLMAMALIGYMVTLSFYAWWQNEPDALILALGYGVTGLAAVRDLSLSLSPEALSSYSLTYGFYMLPYGFLVAIVAQSYVLARQTSRAYSMVEQQAHQLELQAQYLQRLNQAYFRFVPETFLKLINKDDITTVQLGDNAEKTMAVMFADVRGFTSISEKMTPQQNFAFINTLLVGLGPRIRQNHGFIDKYMGDGIMALFPRHPADALNAAVMMHQELHNFNRQTNNQDPIAIGIGLHLGALMLGTVGEPERMDGTVIADVVNTASRLESLTKRYGVTILASEELLHAVGNVEKYQIRMLGRVRAKGKNQSVTLYEVYDGDSEMVRRLKSSTRPGFQAGLTAFQAGEMAQAQKEFEQVLQFFPHDRPARYYYDKASYFLAHGLPEDWDGIEGLTEK